MRSVLIVPLLLTGLASAQVFFTPEIPPALRNYLELTDTQNTRIPQLNRQYLLYRLQKGNRQAVVQRELTEEMRRDTLDPTAIGLRYVELETIRREIEAEQTKTIKDIQALLTPVQRTRLDGLTEVLRRFDLACAAVAFNLLPALLPDRTGGPEEAGFLSSNSFGCPSSFVSILRPLP
jgi:hypothetical protein